MNKMKHHVTYTNVYKFLDYVHQHHLKFLLVAHTPAWQNDLCYKPSGKEHLELTYMAFKDVHEFMRKLSTYPRHLPICINEFVSSSIHKHPYRFFIDYEIYQEHASELNLDQVRSWIAQVDQALVSAHAVELSEKLKFPDSKPTLPLRLTLDKIVANNNRWCLKRDLSTNRFRKMFKISFHVYWTFVYFRTMSDMKHFVIQLNMNGIDRHVYARDKQCMRMIGSYKWNDPFKRPLKIVHSLSKDHPDLKDTFITVFDPSNTDNCVLGKPT